MPNPNYNSTPEVSKPADVNFDFFKVPVEPFEQPEPPAPPAPDFNPGQAPSGSEPEDSRTYQQRRAGAYKNARRYVKMMSTGFANIASIYAHDEPAEYLIDETDR